jgi:hypothetical protein
LELYEGLFVPLLEVLGLFVVSLPLAGDGLYDLELYEGLFVPLLEVLGLFVSLPLAGDGL